MFDIPQLIIAFLISLISSLLLTFPIRKLAVKIGAMDVPDHRKIHKVVTPRLGGLSIFFGVAIGLLYISPSHPQLTSIILGALIVIVTGMIDDKYQIRPLIKLAGQLTAAGFLISSGIIIENITLPVFGVIHFDYLSIPITVIWIVGVTNAINLIDGLDGLAAGISTIAISSILVMAILDARIFVVYICVTLIGSNIGFLFHNFYPAKIYMGDTGSLFLGYSVAVISMLGLFKNLALFSFIIPIIVLGVPILDTLFAILRRMANKEPIMMPDKKHIHYQLLAAGFSHKTTVLILYGFSAIFGLLAVLFSNASLITSYVIMLILFIFIHIFAEIVGLVGRGRKPVINLLKRVVASGKVVPKEEKVE